MVPLAGSPAAVAASASAVPVVVPESRSHVDRVDAYKLALNLLD